jgi:hypothetical protein
MAAKVKLIALDMVNAVPHKVSIRSIVTALAGDSKVTNVPELPADCNSWIIVRKGTNDAVAELFKRSSVERINFNDYEALPACEYLARYNVIIKAIAAHSAECRRVAA